MNNLYTSCGQKEKANGPNSTFSTSAMRNVANENSFILDDLLRRKPISTTKLTSISKSPQR